MFQRIYYESRINRDWGTHNYRTRKNNKQQATPLEQKENSGCQQTEREGMKNRIALLAGHSKIITK